MQKILNYIEKHFGGSVGGGIGISVGGIGIDIGIIIGVGIGGLGSIGVGGVGISGVSGVGSVADGICIGIGGPFIATGGRFIRRY
ncbi:MAG: hypothetical protein Q8840_02420, partial [Sweet potato little leaf phytoplasma]|nr:hypothetical protein [Sweet potato little leaf phytoplasma]